MHSHSIIASSAFFAIAVAVPLAQHEHHRRDLVWVTSTEEAVVTVPVTTTVWVDPDQSIPTQVAGHQHSHFWYSAQSSQATSSDPTSEAPSPSSTYAAPAAVTTVSSSTSSSVYVAPTESSTSVYVAPTTSSSTYVAPPSSTSVYVAPTTSSSIYVAPSPTSTYVAPTTSSSIYVAPSPTSTYVAPTSQAAASTYATASAASSSSSSAPASTAGAVTASFSFLPAGFEAKTITSGEATPGTKYSGDLTYYTPGLGSCGWTNSESDHIVAIAESMYDSYSNGGNPNNAPVCGQTITITGTDGTLYEAMVTDRCTGCASGALDMPESFFNLVTANTGNGRVHGVNWVWN